MAAPTVLFPSTADPLLTGRTTVIATPGNLLNWTPAAEIVCSAADTNVMAVVNNDTVASFTFQVYGSMDGTVWGIVPLAQTDNTATDTYVTTAITIGTGTAHFYLCAGPWRYLAITVPTVTGTPSGAGLSVTHYGQR